MAPFQLISSNWRVFGGAIIKKAKGISAFVLQCDLQLSHLEKFSPMRLFHEGPDAQYCYNDYNSLKDMWSATNLLAD